jgi:hypothetical protein
VIMKEPLWRALWGTGTLRPTIWSSGGFA